MAKIKLINVGIVLLFALTIFLRFWKVGEWFSFNFDEEYQAFLAWSQVLDFHPIWIGVSAGSTGFYLGPAFTYLNALLFLLSKGDPIILAYFSPLLGLVTIISVYFVVSKIFTKKIAVYSSLIYAFSPLLNFYDRRFWNPSPIPLLTIWLFYSLYRSNKNAKWIILSVMIMAVSLHIHLSLLTFWPVVIYQIIALGKKIKLGTWIVSIISYLLIVLPLLVYDKVHNFDNLRTPFRLLSTQNNIPMGRQIFSHLFSIWDSLSRFWYIHPQTSVQSEMGFAVVGNSTHSVFIISALSILILVFLIKKMSVQKDYWLLFSMVILSLVSYILFPGNVLEYYLLNFFTLFSVTAGIFFGSINTKISWSLLLIFIIASSITTFTCIQSKYGLLSRKNRVLKITNRIQGKPYDVILDKEEKISYSSIGGWCYLFQIYVGKPTSCPADESFGWIYSHKETLSDNKIKVDLVRDLNLQYK